MLPRLSVHVLIASLLVQPVLLTKSPAPRRVRIDGKRFVLSSSNTPIVLSGPNVVVKGPPYIPSVAGDEHCTDTVNDACLATGTCVTCTSFNKADVVHMKRLGWNTIRLGVVWAGAQPRDEEALDPAFLQRLHDLLNLTDATGINVVLDNHGDMVGSAGCGNGVPMWFQQKAASGLIGKPLTTGFPYNFIDEIKIERLIPQVCADNASMWMEYAGDPNYNLLNACCKAMNSDGNPAAIGYTEISQKTMNFMIEDGQGRADFVRYWRLMAEAVMDHPSAIAAELMNEPITIWRMSMYQTWRAAAEAVNEVLPDMSVSLSDTGQEPVFPAWVYETLGEGVGIDPWTLEWIKRSKTVFYAFHGYDFSNPEELVQRALGFRDSWNVPLFATEFWGCQQWRAFQMAGISHTYWHYSCYCNTGAYFGNRKVPEETFGACILGWGGGNSSSPSDKSCGHNDLQAFVV